MVSTVTPERRPVGDWAMGAIETLVFDVLGTVVDETASVVLEVEAAMVDAGLDPRGGPRLALEWSRRLDLLIEQVVAGEESWKSNDDLRAVALVDALHAMEIRGLSRARLDDLALVGPPPKALARRGPGIGLPEGLLHRRGAIQRGSDAASRHVQQRTSGVARRFVCRVGQDVQARPRRLSTCSGRARPRGATDVDGRRAPLGFEGRIHSRDAYRVYLATR